MAKLTIFVLLLSIFKLNCVVRAESVEEFLERINKQTLIDTNRVTEASWAYDSNITDENLANQIAVQTEVAKSTKEIWEQVIELDWENIEDETIRRQFEKYSVLGSAALPEADMVRLNTIISNMSAVFAKATICDYKNASKCDLLLEPDIENILISSNDAEELKHVWVQWRDAVGPNVRDSYVEYVLLEDQMAKANNFTDYTEYLLTDFDDDQVDDIRDQVEELWQQMKPFYQQLHAYVRYKLRQVYGDDVVSENGPIPAHLLGNMWAQTWENVADITLPFPNLTESIDITTELQNQGYTVRKIYETAEDFFFSIGLDNMTDTFWEKSIIERPEGVDLVCHASAWDFYTEGDYRIKECTEVNSEDFYTTHHEMGHIEYYMQYKDQPVRFREGANSGFHEAVGDLIALSVQSTKHLQTLGLLKATSISEELDINNLYKIVLEKVAFLPFAYIIDLWRWNVYSGNIKEENYNCEWWNLRHEYQGLEPPVDRSEDDFDPAAKYHVVADVPYIRYFVSFIVQFQFHEALCKIAGQYEEGNEELPLHNCDIYQNSEAGKALKSMLSLGSSKPWSDALLEITGQRNMSAKPLLEYIKPVQTWLEAYNQENNVPVGWGEPTKVCKARSSSSINGPMMSVLFVSFVTLFFVNKYEW